MLVGTSADELARCGGTADTWAKIDGWRVVVAAIGEDQSIEVYSSAGSQIICVSGYPESRSW